MRKPNPKDKTNPTSKTGRKPGEVRSNSRISLSELRRNPEKAKLDLHRVLVSELKPSPENEKLYRPVRPDDPEIIALSKDIAKEGILAPLVITIDGYIISGHRRHTAAREAGLEDVPCMIESFRREDDPDRFQKLLAKHNMQRRKNLGEDLRETVTLDEGDNCRRLEEHRRV
jgi:hypothetical protein